jgi:tetratricopeptide (TPR) repeat protein
MAARNLAIAALLLLTWPSTALPQDGRTIQAFVDDQELRALGSKANEFFTAGKDKEALALTQKALGIAEARYGPDHIVVAHALFALAFFHVLQDQPEEAARHQLRAIAIVERPLAALTPEELKKVPDNPQPYVGSPAANTALLYMFLAHSYTQLNRWAPALPIHARALVWMEKAFGPDAPELFQLIDRQGRISMELGRYADAVRLYKRGVSIGERAPKGKANWLPDFQRKLIVLYTAQGYDDEVKALIEPSIPKGFTADEVKALIERAGTPSVPKGFTAAEQVIARAGEHERSGRHAEAEALYVQELARLEEAKANAPPTREAIAVLQEKLKAMGWSAEVMEERKSLAKEIGRLQRTLPGTEQVAELRHALGVLYYRQRKFAEAETSLKRALALVDEYPDTPPAPAIRLSLAQLYADQERYADAEQAYTRVLGSYEAEGRRPWDRGKLPTARTAGLLRTLAQLAFKQQQMQRAEDLHKRGLKVLEDLGPDRFDVASALDELAELYRAQKRFAEAEPLYKRALEIYRKGNMSPDHRPIRTLVANLTSFYTEQGRSAEAEALARGPVREPSHR